MKNKHAIYYAAFTIALATLAAYSRALQNGFTGWDDVYWVVENPHLHPINAEFFRWAFFEFYRSYWCPLTWTSLAVDYSLWGVNPAGYHLTNIILHAANTAAVVLLSKRLLEFQFDQDRQGRQRSVSDRIILSTAAITGILFGLHPLHVESVAWIVERKDVLYAFFYLMCLTVYVNALTPTKNIRAPRQGLNFMASRAYVLAVICFILALLSKPMAVSLPFVLLLLDWYPLNRLRSFRTAGPILYEKAPFFILSLIAAIIILFAQRSGGAVVSAPSVTWLDKVWLACMLLMTYLGKMAFPVHLSPLYAQAGEISLLSTRFLLPVLLAVGITVVCIIEAKRQKLWLLLWTYYIVTLAPVLGIVQVGSQIMADRFTYLPSLGPFLFAGLIVSTGVDRLRGPAPLPMPARIALGGIAAVLLLFLVSATVKQIGIWGNGVTLWSAVIEQDPAHASRAYANRGLIYLKEGQFGKAAEDYTRALSLDPRSEDAYQNRGLAFKELGQTQQAIDDFTSAINLNPRYVIAYNSRGVVLSGLGQFNKAIEDYSRALDLNRSDYRIYNNRAVAYYQLHRFDRALEDYSSAIALNPSSYAAYTNRSLVLRKMGRLRRALEDCNEAIMLNPTFSDAYLSRGYLFLDLGDQKSATADFRKAQDLGNREGRDALKKYGLQ